MTTTLIALLPALICLGMMFGAGVAIWLATRTPLRRVPWIARRTQSESAESPTRSAA
jgi:hypothetical protein